MSMPGWYADPGGDGQRYFDGAAWVEHRPVPKNGYSTEERSDILDQVLVSQHVRVLTRTPTTAAIMVGQPVNHIAHLLLSVLLCGLWAPVWIFLASSEKSGEKQATLSVDPKGHVHWRGPGGALFNPPAGFNQPVASGKNIKCFKCGKSQAVATTTTNWVCKHCGQKLKRQGGGVI